MLRPSQLSAAVAAGLVGVIGFGIAAKADTAISSFTPGDLVVLRGGDTAVGNTSTATTPVNGFMGTVNTYLDEYTPSGSYVGTISVPGLTTDGAGLASHEGNLNLSTNGQWLTFTGYDPAQYPAGTTPQPEDGTENVVIGEISNSAASLNTSTDILGTSGNNGQFTHAATTFDGNEFLLAGKYINSANGAIWNGDTAGSSDNVGLQYVSGVGSGASVTTLEGGTDWRNLTIFNNTLYGSTGSSSVGTHGSYIIGTAGTVPTTPGNGTPIHTLITAGSNSASDTALLDIPTSDPNAKTQNGADVLYSIQDGNIEKFSYNGTLWTGTAVTIDGTIPQNTVDVVAQQDPTNSSWVDLWVSDPSGIYSYIDKSGDPTTALPANAFAQIATPLDQGAFYGLAFAPTAVPEPMSAGLLAIGGVCFLSRRRRGA